MILRFAYLNDFTISGSGVVDKCALVVSNFCHKMKNPYVGKDELILD